eukprot:SAG25_NODE_7484_length_478_cov_0.878628_2_plen_54_part_01
MIAASRGGTALPGRCIVYILKIVCWSVGLVVVFRGTRRYFIHHCDAPTRFSFLR